MNDTVMTKNDMSRNIISINNVTKRFDKTAVLKNISVEVSDVEIIALLGLNGAGKTTLLETLLGFCIPDQGTIKLFSQQTDSFIDQKTKSRIGFVPQTEELIPSMKVSDYLTLISSFYPNWDQTFVQRLIEEWDVPMDKTIRTLSTGQKQKVAIISALAFYPELLILDEPVASLDPKARRQFLQELIKIADNQRCTILFSTHIVSDVERIADRLWLLKDGELVMDTMIDDLKEKTVRLHLPKNSDYVSLLTGLEILNKRHTETNIVLTASGWGNEIEAQWRNKFPSELQIETLSLEDIFLEINL